MKRVLLGLLLLSGLFMSTVNSAENTTEALDHIGLSVSDLDASTNFFVDTLGFKISGRDPEYPAAFINNGQIRLTLWQTSEKQLNLIENTM